MVTNPVKMAFETEGRVLPIEAILPTRTVANSMRQSTKYQRIRASIGEVGLVEPIVVFPQPVTAGAEARYILLDGHLRLDVLRALGTTEVLCLISTDDEGFTYNHKVSQVSAVQEHFMIMKALEGGVTEERIAATLNLDVAAIRKKRDLLEGICPEAVLLLRDKRATHVALRVFKKVLPMRQIAMAELMIAADNFSAAYSQCLLVASSEDELIEPQTPKDVPGLKPADLARMEREMRALEKDFRGIEDSHGKDALNLVLAAGYLRKLLASATLVKFLSRRHADMLSEFEKLAEATDLRDAEPES